MTGGGRGRLGILIAIAALAMVALATSRFWRPRPPPSVVLIVVDTLRADHLGCYGYDRDTSPRLDRLASEGVRLERAYAPSTWTLPSMASVLTAQTPVDHGVLRWTDGMPDDGRPLLPELLREQGYVTAALMGNSNLRSEAGFGRGFDLYVEATTEPKLARTGLPLYPSAQDLTDMAQEALDELAGSPFLLYVHYMDPHAPYVLPDGVPDPFADAAYDGFMVTRLEQILPLVGPRYSRVYPYFWSKVRDTEEDHRRVRDLYDAKVHYADEHIGRLLDHLDGLGLADSTLVVVTADHGEGLFEHGIREHEDLPYEHQIRVPLIARGPGLEPGTVEPTLVELVDLPLALTDRAGISAAAWGPGAHGGNGALRTALGGAAAAQGGPTSAVSMVHITERGEDWQAIVDGDAKLVVGLPGTQAYDLAADPGELHDLQGSGGLPVAGALREELEQRLGPVEAGPGSQPTPALDDPETLERLRALGYVR